MFDVGIVVQLVAVLYENTLGSEPHEEIYGVWAMVLFKVNTGIIWGTSLIEGISAIGGVSTSTWMVSLFAIIGGSFLPGEELVSMCVDTCVLCHCVAFLVLLVACFRLRDCVYRSL